MQPRMTSLLCLKRSLALRSSIRSSERLWQPRSCPAREEVFYRLATMDRRAVPDHQQLARDLAQGVPQEAHHVRTLECSLLLHHQELTFQGDAAHHREVLTRELFVEDRSLAYDGSVGAHHCHCR